MELIHAAAPQQMDEHASGRGIDARRAGGMRRFHNHRLGMAASEVLPGRFRTQSLLAISERLFREHESVGVHMDKRKPVVVVARIGPYDQLGFQQRADLVTAEQLVVGAALALDELGQPTGADHPADHVEEANDIGFARAVGADQDGRPRQAFDLDVREGAKPLDVNRFDLIGHGSSPHRRSRGKRFRGRGASVPARGLPPTAGVARRSSRRTIARITAPACP